MCEAPELLLILNRVRSDLQAALNGRLASDQVLSPVALTAAQLAIIMTLATTEAITPTQLCERISYDAGAMTRMLDRLQSKGVIRRRGSSEDRRVVYVELTEEGRAGLPRMREVSMEVFNHLLEGFSNAEIRQLEGYLMRGLLNLGGCAGLIDPLPRSGGLAAKPDSREESAKSGSGGSHFV